MNNENKRSTWSIVLKTIIAALTALVGALGLSGCVPNLFPVPAY